MDDKVDDPFSSLPDNIITQIFSYLTMREALGICISSKKLRHLRTMIPNLEFKESVDDSLHLLVDAKKRKLVRIINDFLEHHDGPIRSFRLSFYPGWYESNVFHWICIVMRSGVEDLDLDFLSNLGLPMEFPSLLCCETLEVLKLRSCIFDSPLSFTGFSSLKSLFLGDMIFTDDIIQSLLCQCQLLQSLTLQNCRGFQIIKVTNHSAHLEALALENCPSLLKLYALHLKTLYICSGTIKVFIVEASHAKNLSILRKGSCPVSQHDAFTIRVKVLNKVLDKLWVQPKYFAEDAEMEDQEDGNVEDQMDLTYQGIVKLEFETCFRNAKEFNGHAWLLRSLACVEKVVLLVNDCFADEFNSNGQRSRIS